MDKTSRCLQTHGGGGGGVGALWYVLHINNTTKCIRTWGMYVLFINNTDKYKYVFWERVRYIESGRYVLFMDVFLFALLCFCFVWLYVFFT